MARRTETTCIFLKCWVKQAELTPTRHSATFAPWTMPEYPLGGLLLRPGRAAGPDIERWHHRQAQRTARVGRRVAAQYGEARGLPGYAPNRPEGRGAACRSRVQRGYLPYLTGPRPIRGLSRQGGPVLPPGQQAPGWTMPRHTTDVGTWAPRSPSASTSHCATLGSTA